MKKQAYLQSTLLTAALLLIVLAPVLFIQREQNYMLNQVSLFSVEADAFQEAVKENYNLWEQLKIYRDSPTVMGTSRLDSSYMESAEEIETVLLEQMEQQLKKLMDCNALPFLDLSTRGSSTIEKETYVGISGETYSKVLDVWMIHAEYPGFLVYAYMDSHVFALYDLAIVSMDYNFAYSSDLTAQGFLEYLHSFSAVDEEDEELFHVLESSLYAPKEIHLCLWSENKHTQHTASYCFHAARGFIVFPQYPNTQALGVDDAASKSQVKQKKSKK